MTADTHDPALAQLAEQIRQAAAERRPLEILGGGTKRFYGNPPQGTPLPTRSLSGISSYEPSELVVTVRAGTPLAELEAALAEQGQCLAFEPPRMKAAPGGPAGAADSGTVGGMVAAGLAGPARASVGSVRDFVLGATILDGQGRALSFGGQVMKNVAGYDVARLMAGSLGVLGVLAEVSLKVLPRPVAQRTLRFELDEATAITRLQALGGQPLPLNASAWWDGMLVLRLAGAAAAVDAATRQLGGEAIEPALAETFWNGLRDHSDEFFVGADQALARGVGLWRLSVPAGSPPLKLGGQQLIEWGGAQRWVCSPAPAAAMREAAQAVGGHAVLYRRSEGSAHADLETFATLPPALHAVHRRLKTSFDPHGLFNPGRLYRDL